MLISSYFNSSFRSKMGILLAYIIFKIRFHPKIALLFVSWELFRIYARLGSCQRKFLNTREDVESRYSREELKAFLYFLGEIIS